MLFTFHFDETTGSKRKRQYNAYATYMFIFSQQIVTAYLGTLFVGKHAADLLKHLYQMLDRIELIRDFIDSVSVNTSFNQ